MTNVEVTPRRRTYGAVEVYHRHLEMERGFRERQIDLEIFTARAVSFGGAMRRAGPITIPVVVHVVYNSAAENISAFYG